MLKNHLLSNVVCSAVIDSEAHTRNTLGNLLKLTRDDDDKLYVDGIQIISYDLMATNGVLYIIDDVMIPDEGWHTAFYSFYIEVKRKRFTE